MFENFEMSKNEIHENINNFIKNISNKNGLDLSKIYLATLFNYPFPVFSKEKFQESNGINCPVILTNNSNGMSFVYILKSQSKNDHIFIDIFNQTLLQSTYVDIPGVFTFMPEIRRGISVKKIKSLKIILGIDRVQIDDLKSLYVRFSEMSKEEILKLIHEDIDIITQNTSKHNIVKK